MILKSCNAELDASAALTVNGEEKDTISVTSETDFTVSFPLTDLTANTMYEYSVSCTPTGGESSTSVLAKFKTAPAADEAAAMSWVWVADLAGEYSLYW